MGLGEQVRMDASGFTGVRGVWAAGNVSDVLAGVPAPQPEPPPPPRSTWIC